MVCYSYYFVSVSAVLEVCSDQIVGLYLIHKWSYRWPNIYNRKGLKTPIANCVT